MPLELKKKKIGGVLGIAGSLYHWPVGLCRRMVKDKRSKQRPCHKEDFTLHPEGIGRLLN